MLLTAALLLIATLEVADGDAILWVAPELEILALEADDGGLMEADDAVLEPDAGDTLELEALLLDAEGKAGIFDAEGLLTAALEAGVLELEALLLVTELRAGVFDAEGLLTAALEAGVLELEALLLVTELRAGVFDAEGLLTAALEAGVLELEALLLVTELRAGVFDAEGLLTAVLEAGLLGADVPEPESTLDPALLELGEVLGIAGLLDAIVDEKLALELLVGDAFADEMLEAIGATEELAGAFVEESALDDLSDTTLDVLVAVADERFGSFVEESTLDGVADGVVDCTWAWLGGPTGLAVTLETAAPARTRR